MDHMRKKIEKNANSMEVVYERVIKMLENQTRLESHEKALEEMLKYMAIYCARTKQDEIKRTEVQNRCFRCSNYLLNNGDNENMDDIKPHNVSQDTNETSDSSESDSSVSECNAVNAVDYSSKDVGNSEVVVQSTATKSKKNSNSMFRMFRKILSNVFSLRSSFKFLCVVVLCSLLLMISSSHLPLKKDSLPSYHSILTRLASIFANAWAVFFIL